MPPSDASTLSLNRDARIQVLKIGQEQQPIFIVDDAFVHPEALIDFAAQSQFLSPASGSLYPGMNAHLPPAYLSTLIAALQRPLTEVFGMPQGALRKSFGFFGLSTQPPETMPLRQALPHTDSSNLNSFATVHFLNADFGGTAFYRHKATGYEVVSPIRSARFSSLRTQEIADLSDPTAEALDALYEEIAYMEPLFNRLILYRATQLHSAKLSNTKNLSADPREGRLTANSFFNT